MADVPAINRKRSAICGCTSRPLMVNREPNVMLMPFEAVMTEISAEKSVTLSKVIMLSRGLMTACLKIKSTLTNSQSKFLMEQLLKELQHRFGGSESNSLLARATFLDPQFKRKGFVTDSAYTERVLNAVARVIVYVFKLKCSI